MVTRRHGRLAFAGAVFVALLSVLIGPAAVAQNRTGLLTVRGIDPTDPKAVGVTILWTGEPNDLQKLVLRENGQSVKVDSLVDLSKTDARLGTVVVVDLSGSMGNDGALTSAKTAISGMAKNLPAGDQMAVVSFTNNAAVETAFTSDPAQIQSALDAMAAPQDGRTAMYDGIRQAVTLLGTRPNLQPNILLVTDGADDVSKADLNQARAAVKKSGAALFALELTHEDQVDTKAINSIIDQSGGAAFGGSSKAEIAKAFTELTTTMRSQFVATYASKATQGSVNLTVSVGAKEVQRSFVAGNVSLGAQAEPVTLSKKGFGPSWMHGSTGALLALVCVGLGLGLGVYALVSLATKNETGLQAVLSPYTEGGPSVADEGADQAMAQTALLQRAVDITEGFAERQGFLEKIENMLERADLPLRAAEALFFYVAAMILVGLASLFLFGLVLGLMIVVILALLPLAVLSFLANRRGKKFVTQLPDTLNLLSGSLRAGYSLMQGVEAVSQEVSEPMGKELRRVITEARLGRDLEDSMDAVADRMNSVDFSWAVMAIRIQREVGGNLSELLLTVAETMVQRDRLRRDVSALTAEGRISAYILALLPIGLGAFMWMANPEYMNPLKDTGTGQVMLGISILAAFIGFIWMKKTITIEI